MTTTDVIHSRAYREFRAEMKAVWQAQNAPCWMDGQAIDYDGEANAPNSFELDHVKSRRHYPELALVASNARPAHSKCNRSRQTSAPRPSIGTTSESF